MFWTVACCDKRFQVSDEEWYSLRQRVNTTSLWIFVALTFRNSSKHDGSVWHISVTSVMAVRRTP